MDVVGSFLLLMVGHLGHWLAYGFFVGYALGSIPFGYVLARSAGLGDIRQTGSGNIGATNVLRVGGPSLGAATLALDALKATAAVLIVDHWFGQAPAHLAALGAFLGHVFPVWLRFRGGKGVATYLGALFAIAWPAGMAFSAAWVAAAVIGRRSSLAAIVASLVAPLALVALGQPVAGGLFALMTVMLLIFHRANIARLRAGTEPRIGRSVVV